ncbi:hypothetical protein HHK36_004030 [Tetracentron sinense]|uniref:C2 domain-containing protein n=1 Tax=Tetracentron sinense TaxID=13715 RepID=A0A835DP47_TETSI|nr:hypothetical protein HHK36_004030 [Tetracentron sinense]
MGVSQNLSSLSCELRIIRAKNLDYISTGNLFVRHYLCAGHNKRIRLNTREISSTYDLCWNESISLECLGNQDSMEELKQQSVVFELRWRNTAPILGKIGGSKLLARAEVSWKDVLESSGLAIEKWVSMVSTSSRVPEGLKPPALQIGMKVRVPGEAEMIKRRRDVSRPKKWNECGCKHGECNDIDHDDIFALAAALEVL